MDPLQIDRTGVLQKWSKNIRRWQPRFVRTQRSYLMYYKYKGAPPPADADPDQMINLKEIIKVVKHPETMTFELFNAQGEKVLALKAETEREYKGWVEAVEMKVVHLQQRGNDEDEEPELGTKFQTNAFTMLSLMGDAEVDEFANDSLNEIFREGDGSLEDTIHAAEKVLRVMEEVCEDYLSELRAAAGSASERRVIVLCDRLFVQYYTGIQNRLVLELGSTMGPTLLTMEHLMEKPVTVASDMFNFLEAVEAFYTKYAPLVRPSTRGQQVSSIAALGGLKAFLPTQDLLTSAIISIAIRDVEQMWLQESERSTSTSRGPPTRRPSLSLAGLDLSGSGSRGVDVPPPRFSVVLDAMADIFAAVRIEDQDKVTSVRAKVFTSCVLYLAGCFATLRLPKPDSRSNERFIFNLLKDLSLCPARLSGLRKRYGDEAISPEVAAEFLQASKRFMADASFLFVHHFLATNEQLPRLLPLLFLHPTWQAGEVTQTIISKFKLFLSSKVDELPPSVHGRFESQVLRGFLLRYLSQFFNAIRPVRLSFDDIMRFLDDETKIKEWVELGRWHDPSARLEQLWLLKWIRIFLLMPSSETLSMYSEALLISHPSVAPHLYDVLRYCLKLRPDLLPADYKPALATCHEYMKQHDGASMVASPLPLTPAVELLKELLPKAGVMHCTGKPWAYEEASQHRQDASVVCVANLAIKNSSKAHRMRRESSASTQNGSHPSQIANQPAPFILAAVPPPLARKAAAPAGVLYEPPKPPPSPEDAQAGAEEAPNPFSPEDDEKEGATRSPSSDQLAGPVAISASRDEEGGPTLAEQPAPHTSPLLSDANASTPSSPPSASPVGAPSPPPHPKTASPVKGPPPRPLEDSIASPSFAFASPGVQSSDGASSPDGRSVGSSVSNGSPVKGAKKRHSISVVRGLTAFVKGKKKGKDKDKEGEGQEEEVTSPDLRTPPEGASADKGEGKKLARAKGSMSALFGGRRNSAPVKQSSSSEDANPFSDDQASSPVVSRILPVASTSALAVEVANPFEDDEEEAQGVGSPAPPLRPTSQRNTQPLSSRPLSSSTQSRRVFGGGLAAGPPTSPADPTGRPPVITAPPPRPSRYAAPPPPPQPQPQPPVQPARRVFGAPIPVEPTPPVLPPHQPQPMPQQPRPQQPRQQPPTEQGARGFAGRRAGDWW